MSGAQRNGTMMAFPVQAAENDTLDTLFPERGLTKREYFAGRAMHAIASNSTAIASRNIEQAIKALSKLAVQMADELLAALDAEAKP